MRVLITGDRDWDDEEIIHVVLSGLSDYDDLVVIEGEAPGADRIARDWARVGGVDYEPYPADWKQYKKAAGPIRNKQMLDEGRPDIVIAFHDDLDGRSKGTADMVQQAKNAGVRTYHIRRV